MNDLLTKIRESNNIKIKSLEEIKPDDFTFHFNRYCFKTSVEIEINTSKYVGVGIGEDNSKIRAVNKSLCESLERLLFNYQKKNYSNFYERCPASTNGYAAHPCEENSKENALNELVERDGFLCSWLANIKPDIVKFPIIFTGYNVLKNKLKKYNFELSTYYIKSIVGLPIFISLAHSETKKQFVLGLGCNKDKMRAFKQSLKEVVRLLAHAILKKDLPDIDSISSPIDHLYYYLNENNYAKGIKFFNGCKSIKFADIGGNKISDLATTKFYTTNRIGNIRLPVFVTRAYSDDFQDLWFGKTEEIYINRKRIKNSSINFNLHPIA